MRSIKKIHQAVYSPIDDLTTYRAMPTHSIRHLDPFLFLNHHGPQTYGPNNNGLPFGPHPHRGFETLTYIFKGDIMHSDSGGHKSVVKEGGIQWMTAGNGLIHSEISSDEFKKKGGEEEVIQLWMNLPSKYKMVPPAYRGLTREEITHFSPGDERVKVHLISGKWGDKKGPHNSITGLTMASIDLTMGGKFSREVPVDHQVLFYVVKGKVKVNQLEARSHDLVEFSMDEKMILTEAAEDSLLIFGYGKPFNEPIVAHGPFVMNTQLEIQQAFADYQSGKMGTWESG